MHTCLVTSAIAQASATHTSCRYIRRPTHMRPLACTLAYFAMQASFAPHQPQQQATRHTKKPSHSSITQPPLSDKQQYTARHKTPMLGGELWCAHARAAQLPTPCRHRHTMQQREPSPLPIFFSKCPEPTPWRVLEHSRAPSGAGLKQRLPFISPRPHSGAPRYQSTAHHSALLVPAPAAEGHWML